MSVDGKHYARNGLLNQPGVFPGKEEGRLTSFAASSIGAVSAYKETMLPCFVHHGCPVNKASFFIWAHLRRQAQEDMSRIPISVEGFKRLEKELEELKKERPAVIQAIKEAREEGDLRENAGYDAARERQGLLEARISHIESRMIRFDVIDIDMLQSDRVVFGATVTLEDLDSGESRTYTLLGPDEADHTKGTISIESPVGRALLGKREVSVQIPRGRVDYEIVSLAFQGTAGLK